MGTPQKAAYQTPLKKSNEPVLYCIYLQKTQFSLRLPRQKMVQNQGNDSNLDIYYLSYNIHTYQLQMYEEKMKSTNKIGEKLILGRKNMSGNADRLISNRRLGSFH